MSRDYSIVANRAGGVLQVTLCGFWSASSLEAFAPDVDLAVRSLPCGAGRHRVLVDLTDWPVQSQAVFGAMLEYLRTAEPMPARLALVSGPGLARMQVRRALMSERMALFDTVAEGRAWLDETEGRLPPNED